MWLQHTPRPAGCDESRPGSDTLGAHSSELSTVALILEVMNAAHSVSKPETEFGEAAEVALTLALAIFGAVRPSRGCDEAQLATEHVGVGYREVVVTDGSPLSLVEKFNPTLVVFPRVSSQSDL